MIRNLFIFSMLVFSFGRIYGQMNGGIVANYILEIRYNNTHQIEEAPKVDCKLFIENGVSRFTIYYDKAQEKYPGRVYNDRMSVYKDFNKNEIYGRAVGYKGGEYVVKDSVDIIPWNLEKETKIVNNKTYKLAKAHWRDFDWEAWYDETIPISEGPYKLHGLPGLIVEGKATSCTKTVYEFKLNSMEYSEKSLKDKLYFPFSRPEFKFISYDEMYRNVSKTEMNFLKNSYLENKEKNTDPTIINGPSCTASLSFDFCFCYPENK
ncbi:GLPGLI family protein [Amniculibacterium sp. G2-70]|uniref:GLPGLI family protein n=1 Tax=Amniculibacterium sp. G2-70 TaxID=2767188 RepID=UPI001654088E|nr:GLPGLI family protein [Amniculibacterium sp. G2-70]